MKHKSLLTIAISAIALSAHGELLHHYTFDTDATDSGTAGVDLVLGAASSITSDCFRVGTGALRLDPGLAMDTRPAEVPVGVPPAGNEINGWDGASSYENVDHFSTDDTRTMAAWIWIDPDGATEANAVILVIGTTPDRTRHNLRVQRIGGNWILRNEIQSSYALIQSATMASKIPGLTTLADGSWHHVATVLDFETAFIDDTVLYIDGVAFSGNLNAAGDLEMGTIGLEYETAAGPIHVGDGINGSDRDIDGYIDDVRIYNEALDAAAINNLITAADGEGSVLCEFNADSTDIVAGQTVTLSWDVFAFSALTIEPGIGDVSGLTAAGHGSVTVQPLSSTTYTLTGSNGGPDQTLQVTVSVETEPGLAIAVSPPRTDGSLPVEICWNTPTILEQVTGGAVETLTGGGTIVTDSAADFTADLTPVAGGSFVFELASPFFLDQRADVVSFTGTELTLANAIGTQFDTSLAPVPVASTGNERCYQAWNTAAQVASGLDDSRWANCVNPTGFLGNNGAHTFEEPGSNTTRLATPVAVNDPAVPVITLAYEFGPAIGNARNWFAANPPHDAWSTGDGTLEFWIKPDSLAGGDQVVAEWGGSGRGSYLALVDDTLSFHVDGVDDGGANSFTTVSHVLTTTDWVHVVCVYHNANNSTADDTIELWINGLNAATSAPSHINDWAGTDALGLGGAEGTTAEGGPLTGKANPANNFSGLMAGMTLYGSALTPGQIQQNYLAVTQNAAAAQDFVNGALYTVSESLGANSVTIDDDDPNTASPLFTTSDLDEIGSGCFTTAGPVAVTTTYTVTAATPTGSSSDSAAVTVGGSGTTFEEVVLADNPLAWYRFEESAGTTAIYDSSGNGYHSTIFAGTLTPAQAGPIGRALQLNGDHVIEIPLNLNPQDPDGDDTAGDVDPDGVEGFTIEAIVWDDLAANTGNRTIAAQRDLNGIGRAVLEKDGVTEGLRTFLGGAALVSADPRISQAWCHYAFVCEFNSTSNDYDLTFYRDGQVDTTFGGVLVEAAEGNWVLGITKAEGSDWIGFFDEITFYATPLTQPELENHYQAFVANSGIGILAVDVAQSAITTGDSVDVIVKIGGTTSGTIDNGGGTVNPGTQTVTLTPDTTTTYTLTVGSETRIFTISVFDPLVITDLGIDGSDQFYMTVKNLRADRQYELYYSPDPGTTPFVGTGVVLQGDGANPVTFTDSVAITGNPTTLYQIYELP